MVGKPLGVVVTVEFLLLMFNSAACFPIPAGTLCASDRRHGISVIPSPGPATIVAEDARGLATHKPRVSLLTIIEAGPGEGITLMPWRRSEASKQHLPCWALPTIREAVC